MQDFLAALADARHAIAFTGAGVSTLSGIPDYRGRDGLYQETGVERIFDINAFRADPNAYFQASRDFIYTLNDREPSLVHNELARLQKQGIIRTIITQNIDLLHQKAGATEVIELHGSPRVHACMDCEMEHGYSWVCEIVHRGRVPRCKHCGGVLKPGVTFFGEMLPAGALEAAHAAAQTADFMLVLGSSLVVHPAASLPMVTVRGGGRLAIVNRGETPLDAFADFLFDDLEAVFAQVATAIR